MFFLFHFFQRSLGQNYTNAKCCSQLCLVTQLCPTLREPHALQPARLLCPWEFSRQKCWSRLPSPPLGDLPNPDIKPRSPTLQEACLTSKPQGKPNAKCCFNVNELIIENTHSNPAIPGLGYVTDEHPKHAHIYMK